MKSKIIAFALCALVLVSFSSCTDADVVINGGESNIKSNFPEEGSASVIINISSGTFHLDEECRYVAGMKEENKKIVTFGDVSEALKMGLKPCSGCAEEYKKTEENND